MQDYKPGDTVASIDWLTVTSCDPEKRRGLWHLAAGLMADESQAGFDQRIWKWKGYTGQHRGQVTWGVRDDSTILQLSGDLADRAFLAAMECADNCTRIDLALTVWGSEEDGNVAERHQREVLEWKAANGRSLTIGGVSNEGRLATLYLGQRVSDTFARIYDKHAESRLDAYKGAWRYEVEVKANKAERCARTLATGIDRPDWIRRAVYQFFGRRGCQFPGGFLDKPLLLRTERPTTDDASRLAWLASDVRPAVQRLLSRGYTDAVWEALGIPRTLAERYRLRWLAENDDHHHDDLAPDE